MPESSYRFLRAGRVIDWHGHYMLESRTLELFELFCAVRPNDDFISLAHCFSSKEPLNAK